MFNLNAAPPFSYEESNIAFSRYHPSTVHVKNTGLARFFQKYLIQKALSVFEWKLPETWPENYFLYVLYLIGFCAVINTNKYNVIPQMCSLSGYNVFYQPRNVIISNPLIRSRKELVIGKDCEIIRLQPDYTGIYDLVTYYGDQMALAAESFGVNLFNSKLSYLFVAGNNATAQSYKKAYDQMTSGETCVVVDKNIINPATGDIDLRITGTEPGQFSRIPELLQVLHQIEIMFDRTIGIPNVSTTKRDRELAGELASNNDNTRAIPSLWLSEMQKSVKKVNKMFGLELSVDWRYQYNATSYNVDSGSLQIQSEPILRN